MGAELDPSLLVSGGISADGDSPGRRQGVMMLLTCSGEDSVRQARA